MICRVESSASTSKTRSTIRGRKRSHWTAEALSLCSSWVCIEPLSAATRPIFKQVAAALIKTPHYNSKKCQSPNWRPRKERRRKRHLMLSLKLSSENIWKVGWIEWRQREREREREREFRNFETAFNRENPRKYLVMWISWLSLHSVKTAECRRVPFSAMGPLSQLDIYFAQECHVINALPHFGAPGVHFDTWNVPDSVALPPPHLFLQSCSLTFVSPTTFFLFFAQLLTEST